MNSWVLVIAVHGLNPWLYLTNCSIIVLCIVLRSHISEYSASAALFQCQHSTFQDGQVFTPNIPDLYFNHTYAADMEDLLMRPRNGLTYFFTIPPESAERNCSGTVVAIQYCYRSVRILLTVHKMCSIFIL